MIDRELQLEGARLLAVAIGCEMEDGAALALVNPTHTDPRLSIELGAIGRRVQALASAMAALNEAAQERSA
jgi:hypothetical protein